MRIRYSWDSAKPEPPHQLGVTSFVQGMPLGRLRGVQGARYRQNSFSADGSVRAGRETGWVELDTEALTAADIEACRWASLSLGEQVVELVAAVCGLAWWTFVMVAIVAAATLGGGFMGLVADPRGAGPLCGVVAGFVLSTGFLVIAARAGREHAPDNLPVGSEPECPFARAAPMRTSRSAEQLVEPAVLGAEGDGDDAEPLPPLVVGGVFALAYLPAVFLGLGARDWVRWTASVLAMIVGIGAVECMLRVWEERKSGRVRPTEATGALVQRGSEEWEVGDAAAAL